VKKKASPVLLIALSSKILGSWKREEEASASIFELSSAVWFCGGEKRSSASKSGAGIHVDKLLPNLLHIKFGLKNMSSTRI